MFQGIFMKCCWSGAYLTPRGLALLNEITTLSVLFTSAEHVQLTQGPCPRFGPFALVSISHIAHGIKFLPSLNRHFWARMTASVDDCIRPASVVKLCNATRLLDFQALQGERRWIGFSGRGAFCLKTGNGSWGSREKTWLSENPDCPWRAEWENGGPEFGVCFTRSGQPWKCLLGFTVQPPFLSPPLAALFLLLSLVAFSWEEPGWKQRGPKQKRRAFVLLHTHCESCLWLCQSVFLFNPCVLLSIC